MISIIAAISENGVIGHKNSIPWHLPDDFKHFKEKTTGHTIVMGRKTHESIGRALPRRTNIILTNQTKYVKNCILMHSLEKVLEYAKDKEVFIIGGANVYRQFLPYADKMYLTRIHANIEGDVTFPEFNLSEWINQ